MHNDRLSQITRELSEISCAYITNSFRLVKYQINEIVEDFREVLLLQQNFTQFSEITISVSREIIVNKSTITIYSKNILEKEVSWNFFFGIVLTLTFNKCFRVILKWFFSLCHCFSEYLPFQLKKFPP